MIEQILVIGCFVSTVYFCFEKWDLLEWYDMHRKEWMMERCDFCFMFWLCVITNAVSYFTGFYELDIIQTLISPFCSVAISYFLRK